MTQRLLVTLLFGSLVGAGCAGSATVTATTTPPPAQPVAVVAPPPAPAAHPAYLHALSDLRAARAFLQRPAGIVVKWDENIAIREIDAAIREIKQASIDDGKPLEDHPPVDVALDWGGRLHKALELVETARRDVNQEEDNAYAQGLKNRAIHHIDESARFIHDGINDAGAVVAVTVQTPPPPSEGAHPAYLHALSDMRLARALLERPARPDVKWDENGAVREIDAAINEIKHASIDDGKPLADHPPIDVHIGHRDRLRQAMRLLHGAARDIEQREDNAWNNGLRNRAVNHVRGAEKFISDAIQERAEDNAMAQQQPPPPPPAAEAHPAYLHALSDLRLARAELERPARPDVKWDETAAIREVDAAINEIKHAAIDDGKPLNDHPPVDTHFSHHDRLKAAMELLHKSAADIEQREDNAWNNGLRGRAIGHIRGAENAVAAAINERAAGAEAPPPPPAEGAHPAYLHALSDMRLARAQLERPARPDVKWDETAAIREVDAAINEIKHASIDDGKPLNDHPPIDTHFNHHDRLRAAMKLLHKSAKDIEQREDNAWNNGLRARAVNHIRAAERAISDAIHERDDE
jgi:hypothetical protein